MNNLYVFAIGGSGERVMRSLILMLASGVQVNAKQVIPVFVDNDIESNALTKCLDLIKYYNSDPNKGGKTGANTVYKNLTNNPDEWPSFFKTIIADPIILNKAGSSIGNLQKIIGNVQQDKPFYADIAEERDLLFTQDDLQMPLSVGFVGNPNIGSVVLNSLSLGDSAFETISSSVSSQDGVFVIGSLFGGTGAAGFPLIINTFNSKEPAQRPLLGGVAVLPYFGLESVDGTMGIIDTTKWDVNADSFDTKTRAALMYYDEYMRDMDYLYYVGDGEAKDIYKHYVGGPKQENPPHLVEIMAALSVIDFSKQGNRREDASVVYKSPVWGINTNGGATLPSNISGIINTDLKKSLIKFEMMKQMFTNPNFLQWAIEQNKNYVKNIGFTEAMRIAVADEKKMDNFVFAWGLNHIITEWTKWIKELGRDKAKRKFLIYDENQQATDANITSLFYAEGNSGIAKIVLKRNLFGPNKEVPLDADVANSLLNAYHKLYTKGSSGSAMTIEDSKKLPIMLKIISEALDDVISNKCLSM